MPDPAIVQMEEELKRLRFQEDDTTDLVAKEALLNRMIDLCIGLGRDCPSFEQKRATVRAELAKLVEKDRMRKLSAADNEKFKQRARDALVAGKK